LENYDAPHQNKLYSLQKNNDSVLVANKDRHRGLPRRARGGDKDGWAAAAE
jgi:hypothetical protein